MLKSLRWGKYGMRKGNDGSWVLTALRVFVLGVAGSCRFYSNLVTATIIWPAAGVAVNCGYAFSKASAMGSFHRAFVGEYYGQHGSKLCRTIAWFFYRYCSGVYFPIFVLRAYLVRAFLWLIPFLFIKLVVFRFLFLAGLFYQLDWRQCWFCVSAFDLVLSIKKRF